MSWELRLSWEGFTAIISRNTGNVITLRNVDAFTRAKVFRALFAYKV